MPIYQTCCRTTSGGGHEPHCPFSGGNQAARARRPYVCPVCRGNGLVPNGWYARTNGNWSAADTTSERCRSCLGTGLIWG